MYHVVFRNITDGSYFGVITWSSFESKERFDEWYNAKMRSWYEVVEEGVSEERALKLCSSPEAERAVLDSSIRQIESVMGRCITSLSHILVDEK